LLLPFTDSTRVLTSFPTRRSADLIEIERPEQIVGTTTVEAMQAGVYYGYVGQVDGIVNRMKKDMAFEPTVIATGGLAPSCDDSRDRKSTRLNSSHVSISYDVFCLN